MQDLEQYIQGIGMAAKRASTEIAIASPQKKKQILYSLSKILLAEMPEILAENAKDIKRAEEDNMDLPRLDRLRLSEKGIKAMADACVFVADLPDPVGALKEQRQQPNGLLVGKMQIPLGVIAMIYESRPNVTIDAAILCLKAGNAVILRGGSEAFNSNMILASLIQKALLVCDMPKECVQMVEYTERESVYKLCELYQYIDVIIPRGGEKMVQSIAQKASMPVLKHDKGVPHAFIDKCADLNQAVEIVYNSKVQRPGVCNALEGVLVHKDIAKDFLPLLDKRFAENSVIMYACPESIVYFKQNAYPLLDEHKGIEFSALKIVVKLVNDLDDALNYIQQYGSNHTEIICTNNYQNAQRFLREADASMVAVNASSRFNDGGELGLGAEIGICTSKLHAYGPMGVNELTTTKFVVYGNGQTRK